MSGQAEDLSRTRDSYDENAGTYTKRSYVSK